MFGISLEINSDNESMISEAMVIKIYSHILIVKILSQQMLKIAEG